MNDHERRFCKWDSGCRSKVRYSKASHAERRIRLIRRRGCGLSTTTLNTYRCPDCGGFHFGHKRQAHRHSTGEETR